MQTPYFSRRPTTRPGRRQDSQAIESPRQHPKASEADQDRGSLGGERTPMARSPRGIKATTGFPPLPAWYSLNWLEPQAESGVVTSRYTRYHASCPHRRGCDQVWGHTDRCLAWDTPTHALRADPISSGQAKQRRSPPSPLPAVVSEGAIRLGHPVRVFLPLHCGAHALGGIHELSG